MCTITLVFLLLNLANGRTILKTLEEAIRLRIENQAMAQDLLRQKRRAEEANVAKTKFLAAASHDLRQPVHALQLLTDVLAHDLAGSRQERIVRNIRSASQGLEGLLNSLLDFSKIDAAAIRPEIIDFPVSAALDRLGNEYAHKADAKGLRFRVMPCRHWGRSDPALLERMLRNLIENAIAHTVEGGIVVGCRKRGERLRFEVWDTGPGIPAHLQQEVFREFYQLGNPERDRSKGLGLGLAIVDGLARLLDHPVGLASQPGKGSVFSIDVPLGTPAATGAQEDAHVLSDLAGLRVLVIDDDEMIRDAVSELMTRWGCVVLTAGSAEEALSAMKEAGYPQLILADYRLRGEATGAEAIRQVQEAAGAPLPAAILTGDTAPDRLREADAAGYPLLHKPINGGKLRALIVHLMMKPEIAPSRTD
jgi:signal transduction histidine kinase